MSDRNFIYAKLTLKRLADLDYYCEQMKDYGFSELDIYNMSQIIGLGVSKGLKTKIIDAKDVEYLRGAMVYADIVSHTFPNVTELKQYKDAYKDFTIIKGKSYLLGVVVSLGLKELVTNVGIEHKLFIEVRNNLKYFSDNQYLRKNLKLTKPDIYNISQVLGLGILKCSEYELISAKDIESINEIMGIVIFNMNMKGD